MGSSGSKKKNLITSKVKIQYQIVDTKYFCWDFDNKMYFGIKSNDDWELSLIRIIEKFSDTEVLVQHSNNDGKDHFSQMIFKKNNEGLVIIEKTVSKIIEEKIIFISNDKINLYKSNADIFEQDNEIMLYLFSSSTKYEHNEIEENIQNSNLSESDYDSHSSEEALERERQLSIKIYDEQLGTPENNLYEVINVSVDCSFHNQLTEYFETESTLVDNEQININELKNNEQTIDIASESSTEKYNSFEPTIAIDWSLDSSPFNELTIENITQSEFNEVFSENIIDKLDNSSDSKLELIKNDEELPYENASDRPIIEIVVNDSDEKILNVD